MFTLRKTAVVAFIAFAALPTTTTAQDLPPVQVGGGYLYVAQPRELLVVTPAGTTGGTSWFAEVVGNLNDRVAVVGHVALGYYDAPSSRNQPGSARGEGFLGGVRVRSRCCGSVTPFGQGMVGRLRSKWQFDPPISVPPTADSFWGFAFGGGVDIKVLHVAADLAKARSEYGHPEWTLRIAIGALFPSRR